MAAILKAAYSNLSRSSDCHHGTPKPHAEAKSRLFKFPSLKVAIINIDDEHGKVMFDASKANPAQPKILTSHQPRKLRIIRLTIFNTLNGANFKLITEQGI